MEAAFAEAMTHRPSQFLTAVPGEVDAGDRHVVAAAFAARADVIVTNNIRHFAPARLAESGVLVHTADEFLVHPWWLDPHGVLDEVAAMAAATSLPALSVAQVLASLRRLAPDFVSLIEDGASVDTDPSQQGCLASLWVLRSTNAGDTRLNAAQAPR